MNIKKAAMMLTIMLITILSASSFYILTGEAELSKNIVVNSAQTEDGIVKGKDYEKVYGEGPYTETTGKYVGQNYYIRYTGNTSHKTVIDLYNADQTDDDGKPLGGYDVTKEDDGSITILKTKITSTYKMFSKRKGGTNTEIERVFVPLDIAFPTKNTNGVPTQEGSDEGIASNTFSGYEDSTIEKDVIYHTGNLSTTWRGQGLDSTYNRTAKIDKKVYPYVAAYVYLGTENFSRSPVYPSVPGSGEYISNQWAYQGAIPNVYVSKEITYIVGLFNRYGIGSNNPHATGSIVNKVLFDKNGKWDSFAGALAYQPQLDLPDKFSIENKCNVTDIGSLFAATNIKYLPESFSIPSTVIRYRLVFAYCYYLRGVINITNTTAVLDNSAFEGVFTNAGISVDKADYPGKCNTPIIVKYPVENVGFDSYTDNVYTPQTTTGKVTMIPITNNNDTTQWEKIYEDGAPNYDEGGSYYIRYKGTDTTVYMDAIENTDKNKDFDIEFSAGTNNPCILNTKLRSTYKMFSKREGGVNTEIERVFLPSTLAIKGDQSTSGDIYNNNGIASNTFNGYEDSTMEKDVIYHSGKLTTTSIGSGLGSGFNKTTKISNSTYPYVTAYIYLGNENFSRSPVYPSVPGSGEYISNQWAYRGAVPNVYVSKEITYIVGLFNRYGYSSTSWTHATGSIVNKVLFDENGEWNCFAGALAYQPQLDLPEKFSIENNGNKGKVTNIECMFPCTNITHLPEAFSIPSTVTRIRSLFYGCYYLSGTINVPIQIKIKDSNCYDSIFDNAGIRAITKDPTYGTAIVIKCHKGSIVDTYCVPSNTAYVYKTYYEDDVSSQSSSDNAIANIQEATNKIVIEDCTEEISVKVNEMSVEKLTVEDETDYVSVTVNKKVEENKSEEDEVQE